MCQGSNDFHGKADWHEFLTNAGPEIRVVASTKAFTSQMIAAFTLFARMWGQLRGKMTNLQAKYHASSSPNCL
jgi:glucosamine 6-phosphate synthetase-like amidotransferase/phosphosugar isomerase protein